MAFIQSETDPPETEQAETASESAPAPLPKSWPKWVRDWLAVFQSVQLAIVLLSLMAIGILIGVLMPQKMLVDVADIRAQFGPELYRLLDALGMFNVFSSPWFLALLVLFFFNLLIGSFRWLRPAVEAATKNPALSAAQLARIDDHRVLAPAPAMDAAAMTKALRKEGFCVRQDEAGLYAHKGSWSRFGPAVAHIGILMLIVSTLYGTFFGFKAQHLLTPGQRFRLPEAESFTPNMDAKYWQGSVPNWQVAVDDFRIDWYKDNPDTVEQYYAGIRLLDSTGKELAKDTISVNHPLSYQDLSIYQATYAPTGQFFMTVNGKEQALKTTMQFQERTIALLPVPARNASLVIFPFIRGQDPDVTQTHVVIFWREFGQPLAMTDEAGNALMPKNLRLNEGESGNLEGLDISFGGVEYATGLQIKRAPEVPWVYLSFGIIVLGTFMCLFAQRRLWLAQDEAGRWLMHGKTNKNAMAYGRELDRFSRRVLEGQ